MKILLVGSGGREHALAWKISRSPLLTKLYAAPGNAGIAQHAECVDISADNLEGLLEFARKNAIDLTVVGPEGPLCKGIVNLFQENGLKAFGPTKEAAELEGSKVFCKNLLRRYGIPTANYRVFNQAKAALQFAKSSQFPVVIKADGLAGGKGAVICHTESEAVVAIEGMMEKKIFGKAGEQVVVEEYINGVEASVIAFTDGQSIATLDSAQDHKRVYDGDRGPNTGGMGAYCPAPVASERDYTRVIREVLVPIVHAMNKEKRRFRGILYAGIMFTKSGPKVLEFNVRLGDPEAQPLMMTLKSDIVPIMLATINEKLADVELESDPRPSVCVVMASGGYPGAYETGYEITGVEDAEATGAKVFHAGTVLREGKLLTAGGRVLGVTAQGADLKEAQANAYIAVRKIAFKAAHFRNDIAAKALAAAPPP
ncbi:MAG TPA: phosphoribosylamine--glycine ligase [Planctomycetota bacterium]|nr:phosphoribosylamine--glycine ligase [Planctomycetota bacterium]